MPRTFLRHLTIALTIALAVPVAHALEIGKPVPPFEIRLEDGASVTAVSARGEVLVINLWATWCTFCLEEMPALETYWQRHKQEGLRIVAVNMDEAAADATVQHIMGNYSYPLGIGRMSQLRGFGRVWRLPMTFVIDRQGVLRRDGGEGEPRIDLDILERQVTPLLKADVPR